jgi:glycosyltransferase involved in cell wall biosynthesis
VKVGKIKVLMIGTALGGKGGIAASVSALQEAGFFEHHSVRYLATHVDGSRWRKMFTAATACWALVRTCLRERPLIVHAHCASHASFFRKSLLLALARSCGSSTVFHLHGGGFRQFATTGSGRMARWWIRHTLASSSAVITLSESWAAFLASCAPRAKVSVVPNSVHITAAARTAAGAPGAAPGAVCAAWPAELAGRILFLGRAEAAKGVFDLLAAVAQLRGRFPALQLVIGGDGDLARLRRRIDELGLGAHVSVLGWIGREQRDLELARAAVFALPSHAEGLPMSLLEAMAAGKAVVVTAVGGIPELVSDRDNGLLIAPHDGAALVGALAAVLGDDTLRGELARRARATVIERYSTDVVMRKLAAIYAGIGPDAAH